MWCKEVKRKKQSVKMIENKILIASAIMAVIMLSGVASQCTIPAPDVIIYFSFLMNIK